jgi:hypothetical protein
LPELESGEWKAKNAVVFARHPGASRDPAFHSNCDDLSESKSWIPTCAGMTSKNDKLFLNHHSPYP